MSGLLSDEQVGNFQVQAAGNSSQQTDINSLEESKFNRSAIKRYVNIKVVVASTCTSLAIQEQK
jgi:hypothetical protein